MAEGFLWRTESELTFDDVGEYEHLNVSQRKGENHREESIVAAGERQRDSIPV